MPLSRCGADGGTHKPQVRRRARSNTDCALDHRLRARVTNVQCVGRRYCPAICRWAHRTAAAHVQGAPNDVQTKAVGYFWHLGGRGAGGMDAARQTESDGKPGVELLSQNMTSNVFAEEGHDSPDLGRAWSGQTCSTDTPMKRPGSDSEKAWQASTLSPPRSSKVRLDAPRSDPWGSRLQVVGETGDDLDPRQAPPPCKVDKQQGGMERRPRDTTRRLGLTRGSRPQCRDDLAPQRCERPLPRSFCLWDGRALKEGTTVVPPCGETARAP